MPVVFVLLAGAAGARGPLDQAYQRVEPPNAEASIDCRKAVQKDYDSVNAYCGPGGGSCPNQAGQLGLTRSWIVPAAGPNRISMPSERFAQVNNLLGLVK